MSIRAQSAQVPPEQDFLSFELSVERQTNIELKAALEVRRSHLRCKRLRVLPSMTLLLRPPRQSTRALLAAANSAASVSSASASRASAVTTALRAELAELRTRAASASETAARAAEAPLDGNGATTLGAALEAERASHAATSASLEAEKVGRARDAAKWAEAKALLKSVVDVLRGETDSLAAALADAEAARDAARELATAESLRADNAERALLTAASRRGAGGVVFAAAATPAVASGAAAVIASTATAGDASVVAAALPPSNGLPPTDVPASAQASAVAMQPSALARMLLARAATALPETQPAPEDADGETPLIEDIARKKAAELRARAAQFGADATAARSRTASTSEAPSTLPRRPPPPAPVSN